eukprot:gb/GFBE01060837.1/.p1 GENE.gb/GFBE01060837.1/~~gb/GFBE01060837.1/.p1  ORF type:complete len:167 (+),score=32.22 gb/GFBE01060837.1/:1-501(+)
MGGVCCGPDAVVQSTALTPRPEDQLASSFVCKDEYLAEPKAPTAASRVENAAGSVSRHKAKNGSEGYLGSSGKKQADDMFADANMALMVKVVMKLQAHFRRKQAKKRVDEFRKDHVVQHYEDPDVMALSVENLTLQSRPIRGVEPELTPRTLARQLQFNSTPAWKR